MGRFLTVRRGVGFLLVAFVVAYVGLSLKMRREESERQAGMDVSEIEDLVAHLESQGVALRCVPTMKYAPAGCPAYLTTTDKDWLELCHLQAATERIADWKGTVYCSRVAEGDSRLDLWDDCATREGPFIFFGDADLRERIQKALRGSGLSPR